MLKRYGNYLVTGGSGYLGRELARRLLDKECYVTVLARDEGNLMKLAQQHHTIECFTGDVSDKFSVRQAMSHNPDIDGVFHLAAFKHVGWAETLTRECVLSNIMGTLNVLDEASEANVDFILGISTDKAAQMSGVYGASKYIMEKLFEQYQANFPVEYRIVRYGNVLYSTGSVLCTWKKLLQEGKGVTVTDPEATRYFWTVEQAVDLIFECLENATSSRPYAPDMKSISVGNLLTAMADKYLPAGADLDVKIIGLQKGENLHERILEDGKASNEVEQYTIGEIKELI